MNPYSYWNWALDWENLAQAPVWDLDLGFGGNGEIGIGAPIVQGYCVTQGPFANMTVPYLNLELRPHCLVRGFTSGTALARLGKIIRSEALQKLFQESHYEAFNLNLEKGPHLSVPRFVNGDFALQTAPSGAYPCSLDKGNRLTFNRPRIHPSSYSAGSAVVGMATNGSTDSTIRLRRQCWQSRY